MDISDRSRGRRAPTGAARRLLASAWVVAAGAALLAGAAWLREPAIGYVAASALATAAALAAAVAIGSRARWWSVAGAGVLAAFCVAAGLVQRDLARIDDDWGTYRDGLVRAGTHSLVAALDTATLALRDVALRALSAPRDPRRAFDALESLVSRREERGVVLYRSGVPAAWAGRLYARPESLSTPLGAAFSPFYLTLQAEASEGATRAVATAVVHAEPPADRITNAVDEGIAHRAGLNGFRFLPPADAPGAPSGAPPDEAVAYAPLGDTLFWIAPVAPAQDQAWFRAERKGQVTGGTLLVTALILYGIAMLRRESSLWLRLVPVGVALGCLGLVRLNLFSSRSPLFDPAVYFVRAGGPFTATVASLILAAATVLLGMFVLLRARLGGRSRWPALAVVLAIMGTGPFLLGALSRGISAPMSGITTGLWLAWEVGLFLVAAALLLGGASAGSALLGASRGLPSPTAPILAGVAAAVAPVVLDAPAEWPGWYPALWIAAIGALALTRRHRALVLTAATVAALGATTLAWRADVAGRVTLANRDVAELMQENPYLTRLLADVGRSLSAGAAPISDVALLRSAVDLELDRIGNAVALASWSAAGDVLGVLPLGPADIEPDELAALIEAARDAGRPEVRLLLGRPGVYHALAVPFPGGTVTSVVVAPRTRAIGDNPNNVLLGVPPRESGEPPYLLTLVPHDSAAPTPGGTWRRENDELHGHRLLSTGRGVERAHILIDLQSFGVLLQRGTLVVLFDLLLVLGLWALSVSPRGALQRWLRGRRRRWAQSYRLRLTLALFAFFIIPAVAFAAWSYQRLRASDRQSRELLVREALRTASAAQTAQRRGDASPGADAAPPAWGAPAAGAPTLDARRPALLPDLPLFVFRKGELEASTEPVLAALAPGGRFLPPEVYEHLILEEEVEATSIQRVGDHQALFGYRAPLRGPGERTVLAAPATGSEQALDLRRRDLGVLVLFATVVGALAALWLSGVAANQLAEPIGRLRGAALAIAGGELEPPLPPRPPAEFAPVFSAFRRMGRDLRESRAALEDAQRRTSAVLRNVASAVVAVDGDGAVVLANPRAEALLGGELQPGLPVERVSPPELYQRIRAFLTGSVDEEEFDFSAGERQLHARLTRLTRGRGGAVLTLDDVTELARAQRVLAWGEMARQVAHEIKNPLTPIRLGVQHLRRAYGDARADFEQILDRNVERILAEIDRLDQIARGFSRYGMAPAERQPAEAVDVAAVTRDVVALEHLGRDGVEWRLSGADAPAPAQARDDELREVLLNILENARHAAARKVEVRVMRDDGRVVIEVGDDGHGIPAHLLPRIFEPHFSTRTSGSGLGLAISRQIIEGWGGAIAISSAEGSGTTVRIELRAG